jgi:hypothetical protein
MNCASIIFSVLAGVAAVTAVATPAPAQAVADGFYQVSVDSNGTQFTSFTPIAEVLGASVQERSLIEKRREGCGPGSGSPGDADNAKYCLETAFGSKISLDSKKWAYVSS